MGRQLLLAAVLDNEPVLGSIWVGYLALAAAGYLTCRRYSNMFYVMLPIAAAFALPLVLELYDPEVGPAIRSESWSYFVQANLAIAVALAGPYLGALACERRFENTTGA